MAAKKKEKTEKGKEKEISIKDFQRITGSSVEKFLKGRREILGKLKITVQELDWRGFEFKASDCYHYPDGRSENYFFAILLDGEILEAPTYYHGRTAERVYLTDVWGGEKKWHAVTKFIVEYIDKKIPGEKDNGVFIKLYVLTLKFPDINTLKKAIIGKIVSTNKAERLLAVARNLGML